MKLSTTTITTRKYFGDIGSIQQIAKAGFDAFDMSLCFENKNGPFYTNEWLDFAKEVKKTAKESGIICNQAHAPFRHCTTKENVIDFIPNIIRAIDFCEVIECPTLIVHPHNNFSSQDNYDWHYKEIVPIAQKKGITIATENMWNRFDGETYYSKPSYTGRTYPTACGTEKDFCEMVDIVNSPNFCACLDIGHAYMENAPTAPALIRALGSRLKALHVHDNDFQGDLHLLPYMGKIDWTGITQALADINYDGDLTYEITPSLISTTDEEFTPIAAKFVADVGRHLIDQIEKKKVK